MLQVTRLAQRQLLCAAVATRGLATNQVQRMKPCRTPCLKDLRFARELPLPAFQAPAAAAAACQTVHQLSGLPLRASLASSSVGTSSVYVHKEGGLGPTLGAQQPPRQVKDPEDFWPHENLKVLPPCARHAALRSPPSLCPPCGTDRCRRGWARS
jgi:hypothetical protein